jgi:diacylglycerol kinase (ATP)
MPQYRIIANPACRRGGGAQLIPIVVEKLKAHHIEFDLAYTQRPGHAIELACQAAREGVQVVVAAGGDGTSNEVLNGLMQARHENGQNAAMAVLPIGRGNDFAFSMGAPTDLEKAITALVSGHTRLIDVGLVTGGDYPQGRYFGNGVGIGFDAITGFEALKIPLLTGFLNYLVAALKTIFIIKDPLVEIQLDQERLELPVLMVSIMNGRRLGGGFWSAPNAICDDGLFDLCIAREVGRLQMLALVPRFLNGTQASHSAITVTRSRRVSVKALTGSLAAHADGETLCYACPQLELEVLPRQIALVVG